MPVMFFLYIEHMAMQLILIINMCLEVAKPLFFAVLVYIDGT